MSAQTEMAPEHQRVVERSGRAVLSAIAVLAAALIALPAAAQVVHPAPIEAVVPYDTPEVAAPDADTVRSLEQFNDDRYAMFIHWGLYAQAAGVIRGKNYYGASEWMMYRSHTKSAEYLSLAKKFDPVDFDARRWVALMKAAGVRYFVITAKHHDGFAMYHSAASSNNIVDATPFKRDPLKELVDAAHAAGIGVGFYYSQFHDWTDPNGWGNTWEFDPKTKDFDEYFERKVIPQVTELLTNYGPLREIWFDLPGPMPRVYSERLRALVKRLQPGCLLNSRIGNGLGDYVSPRDLEVLPASLAPPNWEAIFTNNNSWGFSRLDNDFKSSGTLIRLLATTASRGGNFMLNVGPDPLGRIPAVAEQRLRAVGRWLDRNGTSIYSTARSPLPQMPWGVATQRGRALFLHVLDRPSDGVIQVPGLIEHVTGVRLLDGSRPLAFSQSPDLSITLPPSPAPEDDLVVVVDTAKPVADHRSEGIALAPHYGRQPLEVADAARGTGVHLYQVNTDLAVDDWRKFFTVRGLVDPSRFIGWKVQVSQPGDYHVDLQYSATAAQAGREGTIAVGEQRLSFPVVETGNIDRNKTTMLAMQRVGVLHFAAPGRYLVRVAPMAAGEELFTLRTLFLSPVN